METPEGQSVGVVKNISMMSKITLHSDSSNVKNIIDNYKDFIDFSDITVKTLSLTKIFLNGNWLGGIVKPLPLYKLLKYHKKNGSINVYTSISYDNILNEL